MPHCIQHGYDRASNRLYREDPVAAANSQNFDELYAYDGINQLTDFDRGNLNAGKDGLVAASMTFAQEWALDPTGNWPTFKQDDDGDASWDLNQSRTHSKANEITQIGGSSAYVAHDRNGNMTKIPQPDDWTDDYDLTYDAWNRLVEVEEDAATVAEYTYDGSYRRTEKTVSGTTRRFYYNGAWQCLEERLDASTDPDRQFVWGQRYVDDPILRDRDTSDPTDGTLDERLYALQDPNWNVVALADTNGDVQERYAYGAYGGPTILTPSFTTRANSTYGWETLYAGYRFDEEAGLYRVRHRVLRPELGWLARDPVASDLKLYRYVRNNPTIYVDPSGLKIHVVNPVFSYISGNYSWYDAKVNEGFAPQVMLALQEVIGDCARLRLTNKKIKTLWSGQGNDVTYLVSADIGYFREKQNCKNGCCWQDLKKAIDDKRTFTIRHTKSTDAGKNGWNGEVILNPDFHPVLWVLHPGGFLVAQPAPFASNLWHELIGHGLYGYSHSFGNENVIDPDSKHYDPTIRIENMARRCLGEPERVHQYHNPDNREPDPYERMPYSDPLPPLRKGPLTIGPAP